MLATEQDAKLQVTTHVYDPRNVETGRQYMDGSRVTLGYDALSRLTLIYDAVGLWAQT